MTAATKAMITEMTKVIVLGAESSSILPPNLSPAALGLTPKFSLSRLLRKTRIGPYRAWIGCGKLRAKLVLTLWACQKGLVAILGGFDESTHQMG
jgi:hypothetical protein